MRTLALVCTCILLCACGQNGALYLPEKRSAEVPAAAPTPSTDPAADPNKKKAPPPAKE